MQVPPAHPPWMVNHLTFPSREPETPKIRDYYGSHERVPYAEWMSKLAQAGFLSGGYRPMPVTSPAGEPFHKELQVQSQLSASGESRSKDLVL